MPGQPDHDPTEDPRRLVVMLPALNEEASIGEVLARIPEAIEGIGRVTTLVIDDGSTDRTAEIARAAGAEVVSHRRNQGVGATFRTGIAAALDRGADFIVNMDSDGQFAPEDIPTLLAPLLNDAADMVTCTRFGKPEFMPEMPGIKRWGNRMMCHLINRICWNSDYTDVSCGFRAYTRRTAMRLTLFGDFTYTQETFIDLLGKGVHIVEVPLKVRGVREHGDSRVANNLWRYGTRSFSIIVRAARDVRPLEFFGGIGLLLVLLGLLCGAFVFGWWLHTGGTSPFRSLVTGSAAFLVLGFLLGVLALVADMLGRQRVLLERVLLELRSAPSDRGASPNGD